MHVILIRNSITQKMYHYNVLLKISVSHLHFIIFFVLTILFQASAGLLADARAVVDVGRAEAANYRAEYGRPIPCKVY